MGEKMKGITFQEMIFRLQRFWTEKGCILVQPWDIEMGAGTFHPATFFYALNP
ncbi:MAG TPA: glycine--tRNA ligase subunit alpha, partial [bacterium]|nr:glycine--tRNA ligase subunit alpha [bacterium]